MISGPRIAKSRDGLAELLVRLCEGPAPELHLLAQDLLLDDDLLVDALAVDATGGPVLVFLAPESEPAALPARLLAARVWARRNAPLLAAASPRAGALDWARARVWVLAFDLPSGMHDLLAEASGGRLEVRLVRWLRHQGQVRVHAEAGRASEAPPPAESAPGPATRDPRGHLTTFLERLDRRVRLHEDGTSGAILLGDTTLARLQGTNGDLHLHIEDRAPLALRDEPERSEALELLLRRYFAATAPAALQAATQPSRARGHADPARPEFEAPRVSPEEFTALSGAPCAGIPPSHEGTAPAGAKPGARPTQEESLES
ncbi:MAG: hypothetical protein IT458_15515 [Planctomycetes bacterium]|nr:hypothetical protein [Planctomycetota bacterium]